jgi:hypothetical protein
MRGLNSAEFIRRFLGLAQASNPNLERDFWNVGGADWIRGRHAVHGPRFSFQLETHVVEYRRGADAAWSLLVVIERWWPANRSRSIREARWARMLDGRASQALAWLKRQTPET